MEEVKNGIRPEYLRKDGTVAMAGALDMGGYPIVDRGFTYRPQHLTGWTAVKVGTGDNSLNINHLYLTTGANANSSSLFYFYLALSARGQAQDVINWDKKMRFRVRLEREAGDNAALIAYFQVGAATTYKALDAKGIGFTFNNLALWGESFGAELGTVDLATNCVVADVFDLEIIHTPATSVEFLIDGVLKDSITTAAKIPSGVSSGALLNVSIGNSAVATAGTMRCMVENIWIGN